MKSNAILALCLSVLVYGGCRNIRKKKNPVNRDTSITHITSFNTLFLENRVLNHFFEANPAYAAYTEQFNDFYKHRNYEFAWFDSTGLTEQAYNFINLQNNYISQFSDSTLYNAQLIQLYNSFINKKFYPQHSDSLVMKTELLLKGQFFQFAIKV